MYIDQFFNYLTNEKRYSKHTIRSYRSDLNQFVEFLNSIDEDFNPLATDHRVIRKWIVFLMESGNTPRSVHRKVTTLKSFFKFLLRSEVIEINPTEKVILPKMGKALPHFVGKDKMNLLFDQFKFPDGFGGKRDRIIMLVFYGTGMRRSELINLKLADIDFHYQQLKVLGKRNKERLIPFNNELLANLHNYISARKEYQCSHQYLFITDKGDPANESMIYRLVNKYLGSITTLDKTSPHVLRHTFATQMLNNGADINAIKELLGHANLSATQIYTHTTFEKLNTIYKQAHPRA